MHEQDGRPLQRLLHDRRGTNEERADRSLWPEPERGVGVRQEVEGLPMGSRSRSYRASFRIRLFAILPVLLVMAGAAAAADPQPTLATHARDRIPVLMYHRITCPPPDARFPSLWVCPRRFDRTMAALKAAGWDTLTATQVANRLRIDYPIPDKTFVIVIDDGWRDGFDKAYPILEKYGFEGVYAVVVGRVGVKSNAMTWSELIELRDSGHEIANHTMSHANVTSPTVDLWRQIERSSQILGEKLGRRPGTFVYPYGSYDAAAIEQVRQSGFLVAFTTEYGCVRTWGDRFTEERTRVNGSDTPTRVLEKVAPCA